MYVLNVTEGVYVNINVGVLGARNVRAKIFVSIIAVSPGVLYVVGVRCVSMIAGVLSA